MSENTHNFKTGDRVWVYRDPRNGRSAKVVRTTKTQIAVTTGDPNREQRFRCDGDAGRLVGEVHDRWRPDTKVVPYTARHDNILAVRKYRTVALEIQQMADAVANHLTGFPTDDCIADIEPVAREAFVAMTRLHAAVFGTRSEEDPPVE